LFGINKHVPDSVMMNDDLTMVVVMVNDDENDFHYVNYNDHDHDHDHDLLNVDFVVYIVSLLLHDHKSIDPNNDKTHDEDNTDKVMSLKIKK
jgi:hypothetical protein